MATKVDRIKEIKSLLKAYVDNGGNPSDLSKKDNIYRLVQNTKILENGKALTLAEKFSYLGYPRPAKIAANLEDALKQDIATYLAQGGSFHVERKSLPFFERLHSYAKQRKISHEQAMKSLGYKNYSDTYYRFLGLKKLPEFCDENGYLHLDRKVNECEKMHIYLQSCADTLNIPMPLVVMLLCDKKMAKCSIETDYLEFAKSRILSYAEKNGTLVGFSKKEPAVYNMLRNIRRKVSQERDPYFSMLECLELLGLDYLENKLTNTPAKSYDLSKEFAKLKEKYGSRPISATDLSGSLKAKIAQNAAHIGISPKDYIRANGLNYKGFNAIKSLRAVYVNKYPYIDEMLQRRDEIMQEHESADLCEEEKFENKVAAVKQVYSEYKNKIANFEGKLILGEGK